MGAVEIRLPRAAIFCGPSSRTHDQLSFVGFPRRHAGQAELLVSRLLIRRMFAPMARDSLRDFFRSEPAVARGVEHFVRSKVGNSRRWRRSLPRGLFRSGHKASCGSHRSAASNLEHAVERLIQRPVIFSSPWPRAVSSRASHNGEVQSTPLPLVWRSKALRQALLPRPAVTRSQIPHSGVHPAPAFASRSMLGQVPFSTARVDPNAIGMEIWFER